LGDLLLVVVLPFVIVFFISFYLFLTGKLQVYIPLFFVLSSFASVLFALIFQHYLSSIVLHLETKNHFHYILFNAFIYSASIEEISKMFFFFLTCNFLHLGVQSNMQFKNAVNKTNLQQIQSKIIPGVAMLFASSFAAFETVGYAIYEPSLLFFRLFSATLLHIFIAPIYAGMFKKKVLSSMALSIAIHGTYNFLIDASNITFPFSYAVLIILFLKNMYGFKKIQKSNLHCMQ